MDVIKTFQEGEITLNEARIALGLDPDPILGKRRWMELVPPVYVVKGLNVDEYLAQFDDLESTVHGIQDEAQPVFEKEWIRFISNLRIQLSSIHQKSIDPATKRKIKKRMQDKVRRETATLTDLIASHTKRLHEPMAPYLDSFLSHISRRMPREISFDDIYQKVAKAEAERIMESYKSRIEDIMDQAEDEESLQKEMDSFWGDVEKRARLVSKTITVKMSNQVLQIHYQKYGFDEKMWKAEKDACPYCAKLNGRIVGMDLPIRDKSWNRKVSNRWK